MSKSSAIVSKSLLNRHFVIVRLGRIRIKIYQPFVKDLARAFADMGGDISLCSLGNLSIDSMATLLYRNAWKRKLFLWYVKRYATYHEISVATKQIADIVTGKDIFDAVKVDKVKRDKVIDSVGNNTIAGVIPTIMEHLQLSFQDVFEGINYPTLLLMMTDKVRSLSGGEKKIVKTSGAEMAARRKK